MKILKKDKQQVCVITMHVHKKSRPFIKAFIHSCFDTG